MEKFSSIAVTNYCVTSELNHVSTSTLLKDVPFDASSKVSFKIRLLHKSSSFLTDISSKVEVSNQNVTVVYARGAPEIIFKNYCNSLLRPNTQDPMQWQTQPLHEEKKQKILAHLEASAQNGFRMIGFAMKKIGVEDIELAYASPDFTFVGVRFQLQSFQFVEKGNHFIALKNKQNHKKVLLCEDKIRANVDEAIHNCRKAGINVIMVIHFASGSSVFEFSF